MHRRHFLSLIATSAIMAACGTQTPTSGLHLAVASSLKDVMQALDAAYASQTSTAAATIQAAGSGAVATQLIAGAKADVFAAADRAAMDKVVAAGLIDATAVTVIAHGQLVVAVRRGAAVSDLQALASSGITVVMADATVPAGK